MERKTTAAYVTVFEEIKRLLPELNVRKAMTDYEIALQNALRRVFPGIDLNGCFYHQASVINVHLFYYFV